MAEGIIEQQLKSAWAVPKYGRLIFTQSALRLYYRDMSHCKKDDMDVRYMRCLANFIRNNVGHKANGPHVMIKSSQSSITLGYVCIDNDALRRIAGYARAIVFVSDKVAMNEHPELVPLTLHDLAFIHKHPSIALSDVPRQNVPKDLEPPLSSKRLQDEVLMKLITDDFKALDWYYYYAHCRGDK
ncbi:MAG: hypothetical protein Pg6A_19510 [Termitinemataceae bacterium]|nr:MAG: hypothetical protein Pg6A_19510 [Termitinemataceae bacterium]